MRRLSAALLVLAPLTLAACSTLSVESEAHLLQPAPALTRTLVVVELSGASRRVAEDTLVARLASLHPAASYETMALQRTLDSFDVEGYSALYPALIRSGSEALERRLGLSASRGPAEALSNARNRRPSEPRLVEVKAPPDDVDLRERARRGGFDGLLVVRLNGVAVKQFPDLAGEGGFGIPGSSQIQTRFVATLTALDGDVEIWKGVVTNRDAEFPMSRHLARSTVTALADRLQEDGIAN
jgi:hypothetical protein